ncbi:MAG: RluA family pseudouridine synthase [Pseudomonadota bacterium]
MADRPFAAQEDTENADDAGIEDSPATAPSYRHFTITEALDGERLDKALAALAAEEASAGGAAPLSRSRIAEALSAGRVLDDEDRPAPARGARAVAGATWRIALPPPAPALPEPEAIPLSVAYEDAHLLVVDKPAGMVVHPAPGAERGTLVNALLHHCGPSLTGIGGERRPGIVHRIDKDTSGLLVVAKTEAALAGLAALFAAHDIDRVYRAVLWGTPSPADPRLMGLEAVSRGDGGALRIEAAIARHPTDRKRMAVRSQGRHAVTELRPLRALSGTAARPWASSAEFRLETGRTHQIRVHAAHIGHPLVGDPVYGLGRRRPPGDAGPAGAAALAFPRQALHAARLGFVHPITGASIDLESPLPADMQALIDTFDRAAPSD